MSKNNEGNYEIMKKTLKVYQNLSVPAKAAIWFLVCSFLQKGISVITTPIFTRLLTTNEYGQFNVFNSWFSIVNIFVSLMLSGGVCTQGLVKFDEDRDIFSSSLQGLTLILVFFWTLIYALFHDFWDNLFSLTTNQCLLMLLMIWTGAVFNLWASEQRVLYKYKILVSITLLVSLAKPIIGIVFVTCAQDKVTARILGLALVEFIGYFGLFIHQVLKGKVFCSKKYWIYALKFNIPLIPHYLSQAVLNSSDRIMINSMVGSSEAGIYSLAYSISSMMIIFNTALVNTISPWIYTKIKEGKLKDIAGTSYLTMIIVACVNLILISFAPEAVRIFAPKSYYDAIWIIPPVAMSVYFMYIYDIFAKFQFYFEKTKFVMIASTVSAVANIILNYIFINIFGYCAAGYTTLFCYFLYAIAHYLFMNKICKENLDGVKVFDIKILCSITMGMLLIGFIMLILYNFTYLRYLVIILFFVCCIIKRKVIMKSCQSIFELKNKETS